jgi:hypothetical protein
VPQHSGYEPGIASWLNEIVSSLKAHHEVVPSRIGGETGTHSSGVYSLDRIGLARRARE